MNSSLYDVFSAENIECFAPVPIEKCRLRRPYLLERAGLPANEAKTVIMFLIPLIYKSLTINAFNGIFVLTHCFYVAWIRVHSHEKSGSDRKCINIHYNNQSHFSV